MSSKKFKTSFYKEQKLKKGNFSAYRKLTPKIYNQAKIIAAKLKKIKVFHINSTAAGGGVAELLKSQIPLERALGLDSRWYVINAQTPFFQVTKKIHNLLQGNTNTVLTVPEKKLYLETNRKIAEELEKEIKRKWPDVLLVHDPQPLPLIAYLTSYKKATLRLHLDLSTPHQKTLLFLKPYILKYNLVILTSPAYASTWMSRKKVKIVTPAIDPFVEKNIPLVSAKETLAFLNINPNKPLVSQVSRFDKWKDPLGVINAYYLAKNKIPDLQLILAGAKATDDPEADEILKRVKKHAEGDPDIFFYTEQNDHFINAIQTASDVIIQKSIREGFGLTVTEAMWKGKAVIGGNTTGISLQITNGKNGIIVSSPEETAQAIIRLLQDASLRNRLGRAARKTVQNKFLLSRLVLDHLKIYSKLVDLHF